MTTAYEFLLGLPRSWLPRSVEHGVREASNSELSRWLKQKAIVINGQRPAPNDEVVFPIKELIFFPGGKRKTTIVRIDDE